MQLKSYNLVSLNFSCKNMKIGILIRDARKRKKLTQEQLAQKVGKKRSYISRIESDETNSINIKTLTEIVEKGLDGELKIKF
ncbi:MAG: helix-turn-helix transcriptional regulator [Flavobacteriales bacterium]|jgi:transcriptional regulator with XRE-family HTH domain|nr:helix-turn-helix transcriptional regulator [Flavobacteriales bacterium]